MNGPALRRALGAWTLAVCAAAQADIYKWVDDSGKTHYGDAPGRTGAEKLDARSGGGSPQDDYEQQQRRQRIHDWVDARDRERQQRKTQRAERDKELARLDKRCSALRNDLRDRERGGVVWYSLNPDGTRRYYSDAEMEQEKQELRRKIEDECR